MLKRLCLALIALMLLTAPGCALNAGARVPKGELLMGNSIIYGAVNPVVLNYNPQAVDPTYDQMVVFLNRDRTDLQPYVEGVRVCAEFAEEVYNNAEASGIRTAFVMLSGVDHALNAFETTDRGLVYVDCTGQQAGNVSAVPSGSTVFGQPTSWDKIAYVQVGEPVGVISLSTALNYGLDYSSYGAWLSDKATFDALQEQIQIELAGRTVVPPTEYAILQTTQQAETDLANKLGGFWEGSGADGTVTGISVFWQGHN